MVNYDPTLIQQFADRLYKTAASIIRSYTLTGVIIMGGAFLFYGYSMLLPIIVAFGGGLFGAIIGGFLGFLLGRDKAFKLKLQAQIALCQVQIEANTKKA